MVNLMAKLQTIETKVEENQEEAEDYGSEEEEGQEGKDA